jgi:hypothetical protein
MTSQFLATTCKVLLSVHRSGPGPGHVIRTVTDKEVCTDKFCTIVSQTGRSRYLYCTNNETLVYFKILFSYLDFVTFGLECLFDGLVEVTTGVDDEEILSHPDLLSLIWN